MSKLTATAVPNGDTYALDKDSESPQIRTQHDLWKFYLGGELLMPGILEDLRARQQVEILDSGTGDGIWMRDLASTLPTASFTGTDITSSSFPSAKSKFTYSTQDILAPWPSTFRDRFDLTHQRVVLAALMGAPDLTAVVRGLADTVKPGGWIQLQEADLGARPGTNGPAMSMFAELLEKIAPGGDKDFCQRLAPVLRDAGFQNVQEKVVEGGTGAAVGDKELGMRHVQESLGAVKGLADAFKGKGLFPDEALDALPERYRQECETQGGAIPCRFVWGRKKSN